MMSGGSKIFLSEGRRSTKSENMESQQGLESHSIQIPNIVMRFSQVQLSSESSQPHES